jgi:hypothetical protein
MLKDNRCIGKAKGHHKIFKMVVTNSKWFTIHHLFECAPSCRFHISQYWCTFWHDWVGPTILRSRAKHIDFWWWVDLVHDNRHTCIKINIFSWQIRLKH